MCGQAAIPQAEGWPLPQDLMMPCWELITSSLFSFSNPGHVINVGFHRNAGTIIRKVFPFKLAGLFESKSILLYLQSAAFKVGLWHNATGTCNKQDMTNIWLQAASKCTSNMMNVFYREQRYNWRLNIILSWKEEKTSTIPVWGCRGSRSGCGWSLFHCSTYTWISMLTG